MVVFSAMVIYCSKGFTADSKILPVALSVIIAAFGALIMADGIKKTKSANENNPVSNTLALVNIKTQLIVYLFVVGYLALFQILGYFTATAVFLVSLMTYLKAASMKKTLSVTAVVVVILYLVFVAFFGVPTKYVGFLI